MICYTNSPGLGPRCGALPAKGFCRHPRAFTRCMRQENIDCGRWLNRAYPVSSRTMSRTLRSNCGAQGEIADAEAADMTTRPCRVLRGMNMQSPGTHAPSLVICFELSFAVDHNHKLIMVRLEA